MLSFYKAVVVQVVLESLPVSSSGHIFLLELFSGQLFSKELMYVLHIPTLIILCLFFYKPLYFSIKENIHTQKNIIMPCLLVGVVDAITALFFIIFDFCPLKSIEHRLVVLAGGFCITMFLLYSLRWAQEKKSNIFSLKQAVILGAVQGCALMPGISRFAAVYSACCWMGMSPRFAFHITWLVQAPLIGAAVAKTVLFKNITTECLLVAKPQSLAVIFVAMIVSYYALKLCYSWAIHKKLWMLAYYMIIPLLLTLFCINYYT